MRTHGARRVVPRARFVHHASASAPPKACGIRATDNPVFSSKILVEIGTSGLIVAELRELNRLFVGGGEPLGEFEDSE